MQQAYPDFYPVGDNPAQTGAAAVNNLGYLYEGIPMDATYRITSAIRHDDRTLVMVFSADRCQEIEDESWGLDNIEVRLSLGHWEYMPLITR